MNRAIVDDAGELDKHITFQRFTGERDAVGDLHYFDDSCWTDALKVWASIRTIGAGEFYKVGQSESFITHNIKIRYRSGILAEMRIKYKSRIFKILAPPIDLKGGGQWLLLKVQELVP